jgi:cytochrome c oxidase assembly protein subunit 15
MEQKIKYPKIVLTWLMVGLIMVFIQVIIGGVTRLTESGLSITKWEVVSGTLPPMSQQDWESAFELYKKTPQYKEINEGMSFSDFKFIYFWEYIHRFWARVMGFVFLIPFLYFLIKGYLDKEILKRLSLVVILAGFAAIFGWIMVASGLIERPWVNAYKLSIHLLIAFSVYTALLWTYLKARNKEADILTTSKLSASKNLLFLICIVFVIQLFFGGVLSGMKAAVVFPTWPSMHGEYLPDIIFDSKNWSSDNFNYYDKNSFMPALVHFLHRNTAYILFIMGSIFCYRLYNIGRREHITTLVRTAVAFFSCLFFQVLLGIITVVSSLGKIPVLWGVLHQAVAVILLSTIVYTIFILRIKKIEK